MSKYTESKALLTQKEIDALIKFLRENNHTIQNTTLTQNSIDKLVKFFQSPGDLSIRFKFDCSSGSKSDEEILKALIQPDDISSYELIYRQEGDSNYIHLYAHHAEKNDSILITPKCLELLKLVEDHSEWGACIEPILFDKAAKIFNLSYTKDTYDQICKLFAKNRYGDENAFIPYIYLPASDSIVDTLIVE